MQYIGRKDQFDQDIAALVGDINVVNDKVKDVPCPQNTRAFCGMLYNDQATFHFTYV